MDAELSYACGHPGVPMPVMSPALKPDSSRFLMIVDTEAISSGLWMQDDFDTPGQRWVLRSPLSVPRHKRVCY